MVGRERLFVAIKVSPGLVAGLTGLQRDLDRRLPCRAVRWTPPEQLHLTLLFFGQVGGDRIPELIARLERAVLGSRAFSLELRNVGAFPNERQPRIVWVGVGGELPELNSLQKRVALAGEPDVERPEERAYHPHLTLGRVGHDPREVRATARLFAETAPVRLGSWSAESLVLIRSRLHPAGSTYTDLAGFSLGRGLAG